MLRRRHFLAILVCFVIILGLLTLPLHLPRPSLFVPPIAHADGGDWPMFRHDPTHSGYNSDETSLKPPLRLKWSYNMGGYRCLVQQWTELCCMRVPTAKRGTAPR
ncbi:MAG: hypothetical protein M1136_02245 [Chloroflexi bacterium]|nr:hypothetical protein [Chloroflexota bacterium]MCL5074459.1 hypothetical protein [Chloroflexota bacterium]